MQKHQHVIKYVPDALLILGNIIQGFHVDPVLDIIALSKD
mgnify:FL=1|jgi:hypothetical protein